MIDVGLQADMPTRQRSGRGDDQSKFRVTPREVAGGALVILAFVFIAENGRSTKIRFVGPQVTAHLWVALLIAAAFGFGGGLLAALHRRLA